MSYDEFGPTQSTQGSATRTVNFSFSDNLADTLRQLSASILISTYDAGKVVAVCSEADQVSLSFHNFDRPMGIVVDSSLDRLAVATRDAVVISYNEPNVARQLEKPAGSLFLARHAHFTGDIAAHQLGWIDDELWIVNTRFSCLCTLDEHHSFVPRWQPSFISSLAPEDRCHLNGMATGQGGVHYVTALAKSDVPEGWRPSKATSGILIDVESQEILASGLSMPHSPELYRGDVLLLNAGEGSLLRVNRKGEVSCLARFPGFTRGLAIAGNVAIVGLSRVRDSATFSGLAITERRRPLKCGIVFVDVDRGKLLAQLEFKSGIDEIFDVAVVSHPGRTELRGPHHQADGQETVWTVPSDSNLT